MRTLIPLTTLQPTTAKTSVWPENEQDLTETGQCLFVKYFVSLGNKTNVINPNGSSMKMLRECYQATEDLTSLPFCLKWTNSGTIVNGRLSTQDISEYHKTEKESILSDILEPEVPENYFLSKVQVERIVLQK